jgi:hypothetical protein
MVKSMDEELDFLKIFLSHTGKVSSKFEAYLPIYDRVFSFYKNQAINLLEIGVQNGGSLEIYDKYFNNPNSIIGCDIDPKCSQLTFTSESIKVVVGNAQDKNIQHEVQKISPNFDIILDDGSHLSNDIIHTFFMYFPLLNNGGTYIVEDLHASYWQEFDGGIFKPNSSINFFKRLVDVINYEHCGVSNDISELLESFVDGFDISELSNQLELIHSVEFVNSMCIIKKDETSCNKIGKLKTIGQDACVDDSYRLLENSEALPKFDQVNNPWSNNFDLYNLSSADKSEIFFNDKHQRDTILSLQNALMDHVRHASALQEVIDRQVMEISQLKEGQ